MKQSYRNNLNNAAPTLRPVAAPYGINPAARGPGNTGRGLFELAESLSSLSPSILRYMDTIRQKQEEEAIAKAGAIDLDKLNKDILKEDDKLAKLAHANKVHKTSLPAFRRALETRIGYRTAEQEFYTRLVSRWQDSEANGEGLTEEQIVAEVRAQFEDTFSEDNTYAKAAFNQAADRIAVEFIKSGIRRKAEALVKHAEAEQDAEGQAYLVGLLEADSPEEVAAVQGNIKAFTSQLIREGTPPSLVKNRIWSNMAKPLILSLAYRGDYEGAERLLSALEGMPLNDAGVKLDSAQLKQEFASTLVKIQEIRDSVESREYFAKQREERAKMDAAEFAAYSLIEDTHGGDASKITDEEIEAISGRIEDPVARSRAKYVLNAQRDKAIRANQNTLESISHLEELYFSGKFDDLIEHANAAASEGLISVGVYKEYVNKARAAKNAELIINRTIDEGLKGSFVAPNSDEIPVYVDEADYVPNVEGENVHPWTILSPEERAAFQAEIEEFVSSKIRGELLSNLEQGGPELMRKVAPQVVDKWFREGKREAASRLKAKAVERIGAEINRLKNEEAERNKPLIDKITQTILNAERSDPNVKARAVMNSAVVRFGLTPEAVLSGTIGNGVEIDTRHLGPNVPVFRDIYELEKYFPSGGKPTPEFLKIKAAVGASWMGPYAFKLMQSNVIRHRDLKEKAEHVQRWWQLISVKNAPEAGNNNNNNTNSSSNNKDGSNNTNNE